jgi:hypothetical protein
MISDGTGAALVVVVVAGAWTSGDDVHGEDIVTAVVVLLGLGVPVAVVVPLGVLVSTT